MWQAARGVAVVNALAKAGIELGANGSIYPRPKRAPTEADALSNAEMRGEREAANFRCSLQDPWRRRPEIQPSRCPRCHLYQPA